MASLRLAGVALLLAWGFGQAALAQEIAPRQDGAPPPAGAGLVPPAEIPGTEPPPVTPAPPEAVIGAGGA